jgi:hypothetical protein
LKKLGGQLPEVGLVLDNQDPSDADTTRRPQDSRRLLAAASICGK